MNKLLIIIPVLLVISLVVIIFSQPAPPVSNNLFEKLSDTSCKIDGKPIIRYTSTSWCSHCKYINPVWDEIVAEYRDKIIARHYVIDLNTPSIEEMAEFHKFSPNGNIPAFSFGCQYYRIGNSYELSGDLNAEKFEFKRVIDLLLNKQ
jgi:thiol-disulfide isomerase/thioredoxin